MVIQMVMLKAILSSKRPRFLIIKYTIFATLSITGNLGSQYISDLILESKFDVYISLFIGTGVGLIIKYILDKKYIFFHKTDSIHSDVKTFLLYTAMGVITTGIFWGIELFFHYFFVHKGSKFLGGFLGLLIGYSSKYFLDRKLVFRGSYE